MDYLISVSFGELTLKGDNRKDFENRINIGDINAVRLGSWITIKVKSSYNLNIRSLDESHVNEKGVSQLVSDCDIDNVVSQAFHKK